MAKLVVQSQSSMAEGKPANNLLLFMGETESILFGK